MRYRHQRGAEFLEDRGHGTANLFIPEANDAIAQGADLRCPFLIIGAALRMIVNGSINFNHESLLNTAKINDKAIKWVLTTKLPTV